MTWRAGCSFRRWSKSRRIASACYVARSKLPLKALPNRIVLTGLLRNQTAQAVQAWDEAAVLGFVNAKVIAPLDPGLTLAALDVVDAGYVEVGKRVEAEESGLGLAGLKQIRNSVATLWEKFIPEEGGDAGYSGAIFGFDDALSTLADARVAEAEERDKAASTVFRSVWIEAEKLFVNHAPLLEECPICATTIGNTAAGSAPAIRELLTTHLEDLQSYNDAKTALDTAETAAAQMHNRLVARLPGMIDHLPEDE